MRATRRKTTKVKSHASTYRAKGHSKEQMGSDQWRAALNRAKEIESAWRHKFAQKSAEFTHKLTEAAEHAYATAVKYINQEQAKRLVAQKKVLATAIAKFEKKFAKATAKVMKSRRKTTTGKKNLNSLLSKQHTSTQSALKKRGRKPTNQSAVKTSNSGRPLTTAGKKRGRKPAKKTTKKAAK